MKHTKRLASILLVLLLVFSLSVTAFAEDTTYTITINNTTSGHTYNAYQVFTGDLSGTGNAESPYILSNITWGTGVDSTALLAALKADATVGSLFTDCTDAAGVAEAMKGVTDDSTAAKAIAQIIGANLSSTVAGTSTFGANYTISGLAAGYYLVKDAEALTGNDAATRFILEVVGDTAVTPKSSVPSVEKKVKENTKYTDNSGYNDVADYSIGDAVPFTLTGTLPANYADYTSYNYIFHDTASAGLTFDANSVSVSVVNGETPAVTLNPTYYTVVTEGLADGCTFEVRFTNLKDITSVSASSKIVVSYTATLNTSAVIGLDGNTNKVVLEYSNNPNAGGTGDTGKTPEDKVIVFTYELDVTKVDGTDTTKTLEGAEFLLYKMVGEDKNYAVVANGKLTGWATTEAGATKLVSGTDGLFKVAGLDDGTYYLKETKAPTGYNLLAADIKLVISATTANGQNWSGTASDALTALTISVDDGAAAAGSTSTGIVATSIQNKTGSTLPSTGGIGTTIFYVLGGILVVGAAVLLVVKKRMSYEK